MQILIKISITLAIIFGASALGKKLPSTAGLIAVMPLTGVLVMIWVYMENRGDPVVMQEFTRGALWGVLPSMIFFITAFFCFKRQFTLPFVLITSFLVWAAAALVHHWLLK